MNTQTAKQIKITDYLYHSGMKPVRIKGDDYWYHSPFRDERTPSFKVNNHLNVWYDHGLGKGGNILDLVMEVYHLASISEALAHLSRSVPVRQSQSFSFQQQKTSSGISIVKVAPLSNDSLLEYIQSRHIGINTARLYCNDIYYCIGDKNYFSVGFRNDSGGFELSNLYFKGSASPKDITTIKGQKETKICLVFEGFWDFLSFLTLKDLQKPSHDVSVLNSVSNLNKAVPFIVSHEKVYTYLDNDEAGKNTTHQLKSLCRNLYDQSPKYARHKDLNEYLCHRKQAKAKRQSRGRKI